MAQQVGALNQNLCPETNNGKRKINYGKLSSDLQMYHMTWALHTERERNRERQTERERDRDRDTGTQRHRETHHSNINNKFFKKGFPLLFC